MRGNKGRLVVVGDLFELWQSNVSKVLTHRLDLLDRLAELQTVYVLGNHDADLRYFLGHEGWLTHPFFDRMCDSCRLRQYGKTFEFTHGHQADPYCADDAPGFARITAIVTGIAEDRNGSPMLDKYTTVEQKVLRPMDRLASVWNWLRRKPDRYTEIDRNLRDMRNADVLISGHTHRPGRLGEWHFNPGTWAERDNSFCVIDGANAEVRYWIDGQSKPCNFELPI